MKRGEYHHLLAERTAIEKMIAETPEEDVIDRASLRARLDSIQRTLNEPSADDRDPARMRSTFRGRPVDNLREENQELRGELQGVLPKARVFEFRLHDADQVIRGKISGSISDPDALNAKLHQPVTIQVMVTRVGNGPPRFLLMQEPSFSPSSSS